MITKVVAIVGSYRKGGTIDSAVEAVLEGAREKGAETVTLYLTEKHIEFCTNCRKCMQAPGEERGKCEQQDDLEPMLQEIESANALVLGSPVNFFNVTAIFRRFMERTGGICLLALGKACAQIAESEGQQEGRAGDLIGGAGFPDSDRYRSAESSANDGRSTSRQNGGEDVDRAGGRRAASRVVGTESGTGAAARLEAGVTPPRRALRASVGPESRAIRPY
jgi:multimeric flavodoxin WrbA